MVNYLYSKFEYMYNQVSTSSKGDGGLFEIMSDLHSRGYFLSLPISQHLPYDLIADDGKGNLLKIQSKFTNNNKINGGTNYMTASGTKSKLYTQNDFEFYGVYLNDIKRCIYIPNMRQFKSLTIRTTMPNSYIKFYWWEDFLSIPCNNIPNKRSVKDFGFMPDLKLERMSRVKNKPNKEQLFEMLRCETFTSIGKIFNVSDNAVRKWAKKYNIL